MKQVAVIFRRAPGGGDREAEAWRNAVGLTADRENRVTVYVVDAAAPLLRLESAGVRRAVEALVALRHRVVAEAEGLAASGVTCPAGVEVMPRERIWDEVTASHAVVAW